MDHPGFLVEECYSTKIIFKVMGNVPIYTKNFNDIVEIDILTGKRFFHKVNKIIKKKEKTLVQAIPSKKVSADNIFTLNLNDYIRKGKTIYAHRIDDLGGCAALICALSFLSKHIKDLDANIHFVFTRAEEVGFIGLISLIKNGYFCKKDYYISCETSKCISSIHFGCGVVLRLGDKVGLFENQFTNAFFRYFQNKKLLDNFPIQKALLDGGTCEATPLVINNFMASGLACPLGNYHNLNQDKNLISEEYINIDDFTSYVNTIIEISLNFSKILDAYNIKNIKATINKNYKEMKEYLLKSEGPIVT